MGSPFSIPFSSIPANNRVPFYFVEFDNSNAGVAGQGNPLSLLVGQTVNAAPTVPTFVPSAQWAANAFGPGSHLALMAAAYYMGDPEGELWAYPLPDASGSAAATGNIAFAGPATGNGTLYIMIAGREVQVGVLSGQSAATIAANVAAQVAAYLDQNGMALPVTAAQGSGGSNNEAIFTARNKGAVGNSIYLGLNFYGSAAGEATPPGVTATVTAMSGGATDPDLGSTFMSAPSAPSVTPSASGGSMTGTLYTKVTYVNAAGETVASSETSTSLTGSTASAVVTSPSAETGALGYNVYAASATGAETRQNSVPIAIGTNFTIDALVSGAALPAASTAATGGLAYALGMTAYDYIALAGYVETTQLNEVQTMMAARWSYSEQLFGGVFNGCQSSGFSGADLLAFGAGRNDPHIAVVGYEAGMPNAPWEVAASAMGAFAEASKADPARPSQTLTCPLLIAPPIGQRFGFSTLQALLSTGIAPLQYRADNSVAILRMVTTYQTNSWGQPDASYLDAETLYTLMFYVRDQKANLTQKYPRAKLAQDGLNFGQQGNIGTDTPSIVTPKVIAAELVSEYTRMCPGGDLTTIVQDPASYAAGLRVQINGANPSRLDILDDPILVSGLRMMAVVNQFRLIDPPAAG